MVLSGFVAVTTANVLSGSIFEFLARPSRISVAVWNDVAIVATNNFTFQIGDSVICSAAQIFGNVLTTSGVIRNGPAYPDDFFIQNEPGLAGQRLVLTIARATGNQAWCVIITEVI
jgi:hypothetical protein